MSIIRSFVERLSEDRLIFMYDRLSDNLQNDLCEVLNFISHEHKDVDKLLGSVKDYNDFFHIMNDIDSLVNSEINKRKIVISI